MKYRFYELVNIESIQQLLKCFFRLTKIPTAVFEADGTPLTSAGWQSICINYHRTNPQTKRRCIESDTTLANSILKNTLQNRRYIVYQCKNGLIDTIAPIFVAGEHVANVFSGQFFFEKPDIAKFKRMAKEFGFNEEKYLGALYKVPVLEQCKMEPVLEYLSYFADFLGELGLQHFKRLTAEEALRTSENRYRRIFENTIEGIVQAAGSLLEQASNNGGGKQEDNDKHTMVPLDSEISKKIVTDYVKGLGEDNSDNKKPGNGNHDRLTSRQREILALIARGYSTKEIACELNVSVNTIEVHRTNLMERLDIHDVAGLVRHAIKTGVINLNE